MFCAMRRRMPTILTVSTARFGWRPGLFAGASGGWAMKASRSSWVMRPAGPAPCTKRKSTPASRALSRTAGEASGFSPVGRGAPRGGGGGTTGRCEGADFARSTAGCSAAADREDAVPAASGGRASLGPAAAAALAIPFGVGEGSFRSTAACSAAGLDAADSGASGGRASRAPAAVATPFRGGESGMPGASMRISSAPTASTSPTDPPSATTEPATGAGISTVALSVITAATT